MGIDLATWRARIGLNYYHMCHPLQTRLRSSGGRLYHPGVASWGVGEVMNDTPLVLKGCMTVVALSLLLQYVIHSWPKLKGRGGGGKVRCHWQGTMFQVRGAVDGGGILLLRAIVVVIPLLLVIAGDVETNPGPGELTLKTLHNELYPVRASWYNIGLQLDIPHTTLDCFKQNYSDQSDLMREVLKHWLDTAVDPPPAWEVVVTALNSPTVDKKKLADQLKSKYCVAEQFIMEVTNSSTKVEKRLEETTTSSVENQLKCHMQKSDDCATERSVVHSTIHSGNTSPPPNERSQKPPFGCGCGKCTFFSFIERGCPTPISSASSFPYLDLSGLTHEQQQELRGRLRSESREIMIRFQELVSGTIESLIQQSVSQDKLVSHIMTLGAFDSVLKEPQVPVLCHRIKELKTANTIYEIFLVLNDYFSFFNYQLIEHIIKALGTKEDKAELQKYKDDFNQYAKRRVFECLPEFGTVNDEDHADIFVKVDSQYDNYTVAEIEEFRHKLSKILHLSTQGILRLCRVDKGCFQLMFQVPSFVQHKIFPLPRDQEEALVAIGIISLTCGEYQFLLQKDEPPPAGVERKHYNDTDDDSGMGPSTFVDTKSSTFSEGHLSREQELDQIMLAMGVPKFTCGDQFLKDEPSQAGIEKKQKHDPDGDSGFGTFTEDRLDKEMKELDYELRVQGLVETASSPKSGNGLELHIAVAMGQLEYVKFLTERKHYNPMQTIQNGFAPFHAAALKGNLQVLKYFITECNCNPACPGPLGLTPLHLASEQNHLDVVKYLVIEQQIDPLCEDEYGNTPLHRACAGGHQAVVEFLTSELVKYTPITVVVSDLKNKWNSLPIHIAVANGDLSLIRYFMYDLKCDPNVPGQHGGTPLHYAAEFGRLHIVKYLTDEQGCNPSCLNSLKQTPLYCAAKKGHMDVVNFFTVEKHCDPMCRDSKQDTPLHRAAQNGHIEVVKFLTVELHCDPTSRNSNGDSALHTAVVNGHLDIVQFFISDWKCDPNISGQCGRNILHYAAEFGHLHIVKYLTDEQVCSPSCFDENKDTPLHCAAMKGHIDVVKFLTEEKHCDPTCRDSKQNTPLHKSALCGHIQVVKFLTLEMHCDPSSKNANNETALHLAVANGHLDIIQFFISDQNCDPNIPGGQYGKTPLHHAAECGHLHVVKYLVDEQGCNPSCLDEDKYTPLHCAAIFGYVNIVKFLTVEKRCDPLCKDSEQNTPLHKAVHNGHIEIVKLLTLKMNCDPRIRNANSENALHIAVMNGHLDIIQFLISDLNCNPNIPGQYGKTPLHYAAEFGYLHIVKYFTDKLGCNLLCLDEVNYTPLHYAAIRGHMHIVKFLIVEKHCDPMCGDIKLNTPLHMAAINDRKDIVKFLTLEIHCDPLSRNIKGNTALHFAALFGRLEIVKFLVEELKCPPDIQGALNMTPLQLALCENRLHVAQYLQKHSVIPYIYTAIYMMKQFGFLK